MMRYYLILTAVFVVLVSGAFAADDAGRETPFSLGAGARALGMGGGFTALADDASAVYYNPAGLPTVDYHELSLMHVSLFEGTIYDVGMYALPMSPKDAFGVGFMRIGTGDILRRVDGFDAGTFGYSHSQVLISYGRQLTHYLGVGVSVKAINQSFDDLSDWGVGSDVGAVIDIHSHLSLGAIARNFIRPEINLDGDIEKMPRSFVGGVTLRELQLASWSKVTASVDLEKFSDRSLKVHAGGELAFDDAYFLRAGYDRDDIALGAGLRYGPVAIDYAYRLLEFVDDSHRFSVTFRFGPTRAERYRKPEPTPVYPAPVELTEEQKALLAITNRANAFLRELKLDSALVYFRQALTADTANEDIRQTIASIETDLSEREEQQRQLELAELELSQFTDRYLTQAENLVEKKNYSASLDLLDLVLEIDPENARAITMQTDIERLVAEEIATQRGLAQDAVKAGRMVDAIDAYNRILALEPGNEQIAELRRQALSGLDLAQQLNLGIEHFNSRRYRQAKRRFDAVLRVDPKNAVAVDYVSKISAVLSKPSTLEDLQKNPEIWPLYLEGIRNMRNREYQKAIDAWEKVLDVYPNNEDTRNNIEQARLRLNSEQSE